MIADAGGRRFIVVSRTVVAMQAARVIREAGLDGRLTLHRVASMEEAQALVG